MQIKRTLYSCPCLPALSQFFWCSFETHWETDAHSTVVHSGSSSGTPISILIPSHPHVSWHPQEFNFIAFCQNFQRTSCYRSADKEYSLAARSKRMLKTHLVALVAFPSVAFGIIQQGRHIASDILTGHSHLLK